METTMENAQAKPPERSKCESCDEDCPEEGCDEAGAFWVHCQAPRDGGLWGIGAGGVVTCLRPPDGEEPGYYHMFVCERHLREGRWEEDGLLCNCPTPGVWPEERVN